jgi:hypothetical protein
VNSELLQEVLCKGKQKNGQLLEQDVEFKGYFKVIKIKLFLYITGSDPTNRWEKL